MGICYCNALTFEAPTLKSACDRTIYALVDSWFSIMIGSLSQSPYLMLDPIRSLQHMEGSSLTEMLRGRERGLVCGGNIFKVPLLPGERSQGRFSNQ